jgi:hypothetical protein
MAQLHQPSLAKRVKAAAPKPEGRRRAFASASYGSKHNSSDVSHTSKYEPWTIKTYIAFSDERQAVAFEKYLKSPSGRAFAKKRL